MAVFSAHNQMVATQQVALVAGLNQHLTTRADDSHAAPCFVQSTESLIRSRRTCKCWWFCAYLRIKPHAPPLVRVPVNYLSFNCGHPWVDAFAATLKNIFPTSSTHRLRHGLRGYLIPSLPMLPPQCQ